VVPNHDSNRTRDSRDGRRWDHNEGGFTLIELLISVVILPLVVGAIAVALVAVFSQQTGVSNRISDSGDAQVVSVNFVNDVQGAAFVTTFSAPQNLVPPQCGTGTQVLGLQYNTPTTSLTSPLTSGVSSGTTLSVNALPAAVAIGDHIVLTSGGNTQTFVTTAASGATATSLTVASQTANATYPSGTTVYDGSKSSDVSYAESNTGSAYTLLRSFCQGGTATPMSTTVVSRDVPSGLTAAVTGSSCASTCVAAGPAAAAGWAATDGVSGITLNIREPEGATQYNYILTAAPRASNQASAGSPTGAGGALPLLLLGTGSPELTCSGSPRSGLAVDGELALNSSANGSATIGGNSNLTAVNLYSSDTSNPSGAISGTYSLTGTPAISSGPPITDPYVNLTPPTVTTPGIQSPAGTYHPGIYSSPVSITGNAIFDSGIYEFQGGISITGNGNVSSAAGGVFFYITGANSVTEIAGNGTFNLQPLSSPPSPAANMVIWQDKSDANPIILGGNGSGDVIGGTVYAPSAVVDTAGNGLLTAGAVEAKGLTCGGNSSLSIGFPVPTVPTVTGLSPTSGPAAGGTSVTITGSGFASGDTVSFGANAGTSVVVNSASSITVTSPAGSVGRVDVTVITPVGTTATSPSDQFTYQ
jgi:type II secretory pathway pseudopilin PulG